MAWFILSGTPGSGKTAVLRALEARGYPVVEEAATDVIALMRARGIDNELTAPCLLDVAPASVDARVNLILRAIAAPPDNASAGHATKTTDGLAVGRPEPESTPGRPTTKACL